MTPGKGHQADVITTRTESQSETMIAGMDDQSVTMTTKTDSQSHSMTCGIYNQSVAMTTRTESPLYTLTPGKGNQADVIMTRTESQSETMIAGMDDQSVTMTTKTDSQSHSMTSGIYNQSVAMTTRTESQSDTMITGMDNQSVAMTTVVMEDDTQLDDEYATQYFGFVPQTFMNGMYNCICEYTNDAAEALSSSLLNTFKDGVSESEVKDTSNKQLQMAVKRLDKIFDKAESYLTSNIFHIPRHMVLPGDRAQVEEPCCPEDMDKLDEQLKHTTDQIWAVKHANARLCQRASDVKILQTECGTVLDNLGNMYTQVAAPSKQFYQSAENIKKVSDILKKIGKEEKT